MTAFSFAGVNAPGVAADVLYVPLPRRFRAEDAADAIYETVPDRIRGMTRHIIVRAHRYEADQFMDSHSRGRKKLLERFHRLGIHLIRWDDQEESIVMHSLSDEVSPLASGALLQAIRAADLLELTHNPGARLPSTDAFHYAAPNGKHYRSFLRVGSAVQPPPALDRVSFWLLEYISDRTDIITDSPTILPLALNTAVYCTDLHPRDRLVNSVDSLRGFQLPDFNELADRIRVAHRAEKRRHALIVTSVASSGSTTANLIKTAKEAGFHEVGAVVLYAAEYGSVPAADIFAELPAENRSYLVTGRHCSICLGTNLSPPSATLRINPSTFHVEVAQALAYKRLSQPRYAAARAFADAYAGAGAITLHRTEVGGHGRHHAIYVDITPLMEHDGFLAKLRRKCLALASSVDIVLAPDHPRARELGRLVASMLSRRLIVCDEDRLASLPYPEQQLLVASRGILVVDDVIITGDRIREYRYFLLELGRSSGVVHLLVGVSRPASGLILQGFREFVDQLGGSETTFHAVEEIYLPDWGVDQCPWCIEFAMLDAWLRGLDSPAPAGVERRVEQLRDTGTGLDRDAYWSWNGKPLLLGDGSFVARADATPAEVVFSIASGLQSLRSDGQLDEEFVPPIAKLLVHEFWARGRYWAPAITAAILRMANPHDLNPPIPGRKLLQSVGQRLTEPASRTLRAELLLAIAQRKLPIPLNIATVLRTRSGPDGFTEFVRARLGLP